METIYDQIDRHAGYRMPQSSRLPIMRKPPENEVRLKKVCTIEIGKLIFVFYKTRTGKHYLLWPREISDFTIIGMAGCPPCHEFAKRFPMMDKVELSDGTGLIQRVVKKQLTKMFPEGDFSFPLCMSKCGQQIIINQSLEDVYATQEV